MQRTVGSERPSDELSEREDQATSKETLSEVAEKEQTQGTTSDGNDKPPSPDGALDSERELNEADPI